MTKDYCTQNAGDCSTCSLVNYNQDCQGNPLEEKTVKKGIYLPESQAEALRELSYKTRLSESEHARRALEAYLKKQGGQKK